MKVKNIERISINSISGFESCNGKNFYLPNGVALLDNGYIVVADGGNDRICLLDSDGNSVKTIGKKGFGKYSFTEPVGVFVSPDQHIYVADWHNHRIAVYDSSLRYITEFGHFGAQSIPACREERKQRIKRFLHGMSITGSYIRYHFIGKENSSTTGPGLSRWMRLKKLAYWLWRNKSPLKAYRMMYSPYDAINKPNGVTFRGNEVLVSQKNHRCITVYERNVKNNSHQPVKHIYGPMPGQSFGRLANCVCDRSGNLYICDERSHIIWCMNRNMELIGSFTGKESAGGVFLPFSCCFINDTLLAVCGGLNFQIIDTTTSSVVYCSGQIGELHGVAYDAHGNTLYVADRSGCKVRRFKVTVKDVP